MKHIHDYRGFLNESGFHGPTNRVTETAKRSKFKGKTAHDLYTQIGGKPVEVFINNEWYTVNPSELKNDKGDSFIGYTRDGSDYEFYLKDIDFIQESLNESKDVNDKTKVRANAIEKLSQFFRVSPYQLVKFNFDGNDNIKELTKALNSTSDQGTELYYNTAIKLAKEELGIKESLNEGDMTKYYDGFIVLDRKNKKSYKFKYIKGSNNVNVENIAIDKLAKATGLTSANFTVHGFVKKGEWNNDDTEVLESSIDEAKEYSFTFNYNTDDDDVEYIQDILMNAGVDAIAEPGIDSEEMVVKALNAIELRKAKKAIEADGFEINESASINKIQSDWTKVTNDMKKEVELWKAADEKDKEKHLKHLKDLTKKKRDLEDALNQAVELKDVNAELVEENFLDEANVEYIDKDNVDKKIAIQSNNNYVKLIQMPFIGKTQVEFLIDKDQIDELCKTLQKMK
jgi:hypothetical protein